MGGVHINENDWIVGFRQGTTSITSTQESKYFTPGPKHERERKLKNKAEHHDEFVEKLEKALKNATCDQPMKLWVVRHNGNDDDTFSKQMRSALKEANEAITAAAALESEVAHKLIVAPGPKTPFNVKLYSQALDDMKLLTSALNMLSIVTNVAEGDQGQGQGSKLF